MGRRGRDTRHDHGAASAASTVLPSFNEERKEFGDAIREETAACYPTAGAAKIAIKDRDRPVFLVDGSGSKEAPVVTVKVVNPTGAGDAFNGVYLGRRLIGTDALTATDAGPGASSKRPERSSTY